MGETQPEATPAGELVYVSGHTVKTRRWLWRQSDDGIQARDELAQTLQSVFGCSIKTAFIDRQNPSVVL